MYDIKFRKLALHMMRLQGLKKTSSFTGVSRTTLWRWNKFGVQPKKRKSIPNVFFNTIKHIFLSILESKPCVTALEILRILKTNHEIELSVKTVYKYIRACRYSRKRSQWRGQSPKPSDRQQRKNIFFGRVFGAKKSWFL